MFTTALCAAVATMAQMQGFQLVEIQIQGKSVETDKVELIELNHRRDEKGKAIFDQLLFWSKYPGIGLHVRDWRLVKSKSMIPRRQGDQWVACWTSKGVTYIVTAKRFKETTTVFDPEHRDRDTLPKDQRKKLFSKHSP